MQRLAAGLVIAAACATPLAAQERDRSLERIQLSLEQPQPSLRGVSNPEPSPPRTSGIVTLVQPVGRGEIVRVTIPIGSLVSRTLTSAASANRRRQEKAARRKVDEALKQRAASAPDP